jgi:hypothetical protein
MESGLGNSIIWLLFRDGAIVWNISPSASCQICFTGGHVLVPRMSVYASNFKNCSVTLSPPPQIQNRRSKDIFTFPQLSIPATRQHIVGP